MGVLRRKSLNIWTFDNRYYFLFNFYFIAKYAAVTGTLLGGAGRLDGAPGWPGTSGTWRSGCRSGAPSPWCWSSPGSPDTTGPSSSRSDKASRQTASRRSLLRTLPYSRMMTDKTFDIPIHRRLASLRTCSRTASRLNISSRPPGTSESQGKKQNIIHPSVSVRHPSLFSLNPSSILSLYIYSNAPLDQHGILFSIRNI